MCHRHYGSEVYGLTAVIAILFHLRGSPWHGHWWQPYKLVPGVEAGYLHSYVIHKGDCMGHQTPLPPSEYTPQGKFPTELHAGGGELNASFFPKHIDQWGYPYLWHLPHWPLPPPSVCSLTNSLQSMGVSHKPEGIIYAFQHLFSSHKLPNNESCQSRWANIPPLNLDTPSPYCEEVLSQ